MELLKQLLIALLKLIRFIADFLSDIVYKLIYEGNRHINIPQIQNDLLLKPAIKLAELIRTRQVTSVQVTSAFIQRIKNVNGLINAVVDERFDLALMDAKNADDEIDNCENLVDLAKVKPFLGVPFTTKDCFQVIGLSHTGGLLKRGQRQEKATLDADTVAQLRSAGGIPIGVTNVSELCMWMESSNKVYGRTNNPYHVGRTCGGSSGGEAAILAAGGSPMGIGSDVGGSIRMPAFFNGIFGHKPSTGVVSNKGQIPVAHGIIDTFLSTGPMSRYAEDLIPLMKVLLKPNLEKTNLLQLDNPIDLRNLKVYYMTNDGGNPLVSPVDDELKNIQLEVIKQWETEFGIKAEEINLELLAYSTLIWSNKMSSEPSAPSFAQELTEHEGEISPLWELLKWICYKQSDHTLPAIGLALFENTVNTESSFHKKFIKMCNTLNSKLEEILGNNGVLLYPSHSTPAPYHGQALIKTANFSYTAIFNVLGNPVTQVPLGISKTWGVPLGIQVVSAKNQDRNSLYMALQLEKMFGGWCNSF